MIVAVAEVENAVLCDRHAVHAGNKRPKDLDLKRAALVAIGVSGMR